MHAFFSALVGVVLLSAGLEGYFLGFGRMGWATRLFWLAGGVFLIFPEWKTDLLGLALLVVGVLIMLFKKLGLKKQFNNL